MTDSQTGTMPTDRRWTATKAEYAGSVHVELRRFTRSTIRALDVHDVWRGR